MRLNRGPCMRESTLFNDWWRGSPTAFPMLFLTSTRALADRLMYYMGYCGTATEAYEAIRDILRCDKPWKEGRWQLDGALAGGRSDPPDLSKKPLKHETGELICRLQHIKCVIGWRQPLPSVPPESCPL